jgi:hypothetical protein
MKITKETLKRIIKEEYDRMTNEAGRVPTFDPSGEYAGTADSAYIDTDSGEDFIGKPTTRTVTPEQAEEMKMIIQKLKSKNLYEKGLEDGGFLGIALRNFRKGSFKFTGSTENLLKLAKQELDDFISKNQ